MLYCPNCGKEIGAGNNFCPNCGEILSPVLPVPPVEITDHLQQQSSDLVKHLTVNENVLWSGKPSLARFLISRLVWSLGIALLFVGLYVVVVSIMGLEVPLGIGWIFVVGGFVIVVGPLLWQLVRFRNTGYMITNKRLITSTGVFGVDTRFVALERIQEVYVNIGVIDKIFGTGSILAVTAAFVPVGTIDRDRTLVRPAFAMVGDPYKVERSLQEAIEKAH